MTLRETVSFLKESDNFIILTHRRPDGDTVGSASALCRGLRGIGKCAYLSDNDGVTRRLAPFAEGLFAPEGYTPDTVIAVDIADEKLFCASDGHYCGKVDLCIDHHPTNTQYARHLLLDQGEAATGAIVWQLIGEIGADKTREICNAVYLAIATDTGCFKYSNTTPLCHRAAAECIELGADFHPINTAFFVVKTPARLALESEMFGSLVMSECSRACIAVISRDFIERTQADMDDLDNLSSLLMQLEQIKVGGLLTETKQRGTYKLSVRSRAPVNAAAVCAKFDGGGHARAAGGSLSGSREDCVSALMQAMTEELSNV